MPNNKALAMLCVSLALPLSAFTSLNWQPSLSIDIVDVRKNTGKVVVALYKDKSDWLKSPFRVLTLSADAGVKTASFDVPYGRYAVSIYQDINGNNQLDQNFLGIPKEPVGFGNNYKPFGKPKFESALIDHSDTSKPQPIKLFTAF